MSLRPRFAADGRLDIPAWVSVARSRGSDREPGDVLGEHWGSETDPFGRLDDGLLLAESFARAELDRPRKAQAWHRAHGVVDLASMFPDDARYTADLGEHLGDWFQDSADEVLQQQLNVRWHMISLARLSAHRHDAQPPRPAWRPHEGWDRAWSAPVLQASGSALWIGARSNFHAHITDEMQRYPRLEDVPRAGSLSEWDTGRYTTKQFTDEWWPAAHNTWRLLQKHEFPVLWVPSENWHEHWAEYDMDGQAPDGRMQVGRLSLDWHGLLELERRLIEPFVQRAAQRDVVVLRELPHQPSNGPTGTTTRTWLPIEVRERRRWLSILAPIYLQLLEALRRISEGQSGAAWCRECAEPFLTLDARRSSFCTDQHRLRFAQRARRQRLARASSTEGER